MKSLHHPYHWQDKDGVVLNIRRDNPLDMRFPTYLPVHLIWYDGQKVVSQHPSNIAHKLSRSESELLDAIYDFPYQSKIPHIHEDMRSVLFA